jgi:hypothetical protein
VTDIYVMQLLSDALDALARQPVCGYALGARPASEPTALAALALHAHGQGDAAGQAAAYLCVMQADDGSVGVLAGQSSPGWPTSLAVLAWLAAGGKRYGRQIEAGVAWILAAKGEAVPRSSEFGHDTQIVAWSYAERTHSWIEPTALHVAALKAAGHSDHERTREGVRMLLDRQLPGGGCNYGNTTVLGQLLRPHVQPTGVTLLALAGEADSGGRIAKSVAWLRRSLGPETTAVSLTWGLVGLRSHGVAVADADQWLAQAGRRVLDRDRSPHKLALLLLAAKGWPS